MVSAGHLATCTFNSAWHTVDTQEVGVWECYPLFRSGCQVQGGILCEHNLSNPQDNPERQQNSPPYRGGNYSLGSTVDLSTLTGPVSSGVRI